MARQERRAGCDVRRAGTGTTRPDTYARLKDANTILIEKDQFDLFGDHRVVIRFAPGHTPGHQMLLLRLEHTGPILLSGDLYHFPQERALDRFPVFEYDREQTKRSRVLIDEFLRVTGASLWIQHDFVANAKLRKSPAFYEDRHHPGCDNTIFIPYFLP